MTIIELLETVARGEDSRHQFKRDASNVDGLAAELLAFANSGGGRGKTIRRNPTLTEHASHILPYRGMGSGIPRALEAWPRIDLLDDPSGNQFSAIAWRPEAEWLGATPPVTDQVTDQVSPEVARLLSSLSGEMTRAELQDMLGLKYLPHFRSAYLRPALDAGLIEQTIPEKPNSRLQKYRLTAFGEQWLKN